MLTIEVWVSVDEHGDYVVRKEQDELADAWAEDAGGSLATRQFKLVLNVPAPRPVELVADVPAEAEAGTLRVA